MKNNLFEELMKKANGLISKFGSLDLVLSIIANDHEERAEIRQSNSNWR